MAGMTKMFMADINLFQPMKNALYDAADGPIKVKTVHIYKKIYNICFEYDTSAHCTLYAVQMFVYSMLPLSFHQSVVK